MSYARTVVIGDLHGDLHALLLSLADKDLIHYHGDPDPILKILRLNQGRGYSADLEALVRVPASPVRLIFLGDLLDRYEMGYYLLGFLEGIHWEKHNIDPIYILGNHDLHNLHFFANPFLAHRIYSESEHSIRSRISYICQMGLPESLEGFKQLHGPEIVAIQKGFYKTGRFEFDTGHGTLTLKYNRDLSPLLQYKGSNIDDLCNFCKRLARHFGLGLDPKTDGPIEEFMLRLGKYESPEGPQNWFFLEPDELLKEGAWRQGYEPRMLYYNLFYDSQGEDQFKNVLLVDWRVISLVWRRHYGPFFNRFRQMFLDGETLFVHGGISPQAMVDSHIFGVLYRIIEQDFIPCTGNSQFSLDQVVARANRLGAQVVENAINDLSFKRMSGAEILDTIGSYRGGKNGFTQFGGLCWSDYNFIQASLKRPKIQQMYARFIKATGIKRIICGHTRFEDPENENTRYLQIKEFEQIGLEYICVDNSCSRGYRGKSIKNGIEIDAGGEIQDLGKITTW